MFTHANIFSGAGGFELSAEAVGWENIASAEINSSESGMAIRDLVHDMERAGDSGYTVLRLRIPAGGAGALHLRTRIWLVAHANSQRRKPGTIPTKPGAPAEGKQRYHYLDAHAERIRAAGETGILGVYDGLPGPLDRCPGQKIRLMGNAVSPTVVIPIFQAIDKALRL
jgi:hypothetical protein